MQDGEHDQGGDNPEPLGTPGTKLIRAPSPCADRVGKKKRCQDKTGPEESATGVGDGSGSDTEDSDGAQVGGGTGVGAKVAKSHAWLWGSSIESEQISCISRISAPAEVSVCRDPQGGGVGG